MPTDFQETYIPVPDKCFLYRDFTKVQPGQPSILAVDAKNVVGVLLVSETGVLATLIPLESSVADINKSVQLAKAKFGKDISSVKAHFIAPNGRDMAGNLVRKDYLSAQEGLRSAMDCFRMAGVKASNLLWHHNDSALGVHTASGVIVNQRMLKMCQPVKLKRKPKAAAPTKG